MMRVIGVSLAAAAMSSAATAQGESTFNTNECLAQTALKWCASKATVQGWKLKYESRSPANLADAYWLVEIWTREHRAMLCEHRGGRGGERLNWCWPLREVSQ